jgi:hypothetical protein
VQASDVLLERLEGLSLAEARVYVFRLKKCRSFFTYLGKPQATP